jgi:hypothetical protein
MKHSEQDQSKEQFKNNIEDLISEKILNDEIEENIKLCFKVENDEVIVIK